MSTLPTAAEEQMDSKVLETIQRFWGYDTLRPLQKEAIEAELAGRDSLVVLPTGGGKSLCYQVPPVISEQTHVVISPLIALMKDQVDGLLACGYPAAALHSHLTPKEKRKIDEGMKAGRFRLIFVSPERLMMYGFQDMLSRMEISAFAIDEAHCISHWGHDFRPEYRQLALLKQRFPYASYHAYTATATQRVRDDIVMELGLRDPAVLVGRFDRPNLIYRVLPKTDEAAQVIEVLRRHEKEAAIVYCLSRKDTERVAATLCANGINAAFYHAGMGKKERSSVQDQFAAEILDVVVATVAFGMGIDRSNVRCVIHACMPKSIEHYQQETGRAGRDGLEAECVLLYSYSDAIRWKELIAKSAQEAHEPEELVRNASNLIDQMAGYSGSAECRHSALTRYFGQDYTNDNCGACDSCLDEIKTMPESTVIAQKILSCIARTGQRFGVGHIVQVLRGSKAQQVMSWEHDKLSTHGILADISEKALTNLVHQLIDMGCIDRIYGEWQYLSLNSMSHDILKGECEVRLIAQSTGTVHKADVEAEAWEGVDKELFENLRRLRKAIAKDRDVPAFIIFGDAVLRELSRIRPSTPDSMMKIPGIGSKKLTDLGPTFIQAIKEHCRLQEIDADNFSSTDIVRPNRKPSKPNEVKARALEMFALGAGISEVCEATGRATSTVGGYLGEYIEKNKIENVSQWVDVETYKRVVDAATKVSEDGKLKPIHEHLNKEVSYGQIRVVIAHQQVLHS